MFTQPVPARLSQQTLRDQDEPPTIEPMREAAVTARKMGFRPEQLDLSSGGVPAARAVSD